MKRLLLALPIAFITLSASAGQIDERWLVVQTALRDLLHEQQAMAASYEAQKATLIEWLKQAQYQAKLKEEEKK